MNKYIGILGLALLGMWACRQDIVETPSLDVSVDKTTWNVGDTVKFSFTGNPDFITFYSGEQGKKYENVSRTTAKGTPKLQFTSLAANGTQANSLHIMVSNDFAGVEIASEANSISNISKATWMDITARAALSSGTSTASGSIDLSEFSALEIPVYIAFKYTAESGSIQRKWTISGLTVTNTLPDASTYTIANLTSTSITNYGNSNTFSPGWVAYKVNNTYNWVISSGSSLVITGATTATAATASAEAWVLMGPIDLNKVTPDLGAYVKGIDTRSGGYTYVYKTAGTYVATFVSSTNNIHGVKEMERQIQLSVNQ